MDKGKDVYGVSLTNNKMKLKKLALRVIPFIIGLLIAPTLTVTDSVAQTPLSCVPPPSGLVAWWLGDKNADDISGNDNYAQLKNGAQAGVPGLVAGAFELDGVDDIADTSMLLPAQGTLDLWVRPSFLSTIHGIIGTFGKANGGDRLWLNARGPLGGLGVGPDNLVVNTGSCCVNEIIAPSPLEVGVWTHLALTFDYLTDNYTLFVNGQAVASSTAPRNAPTGLVSFGGLKSSFGQFFFFDGLIDEVEIFDRALDPSEILSIYSAGGAGKCKGISVEIDIKPGSDPNCFNSDGNGVIPIAIMSNVDFDATQVDPVTVSLDGQGVRVVGKGNTQAHVEDANDDGLDDLLVQIEDIDGTYEEGDTTAVVTGETFNGTPIQGTDTICIVP